MNSIVDGLDALITKAQADRDEAQSNLDALTTAKVALGGQPAAERTEPVAAVSPKPRKGRRRRRGGSRADQAAKMVADQPGMSASDIAGQMKIKPNYLYRVMADLEGEGRVRKEGRAYFPAEPKAA